MKLQVCDPLVPPLDDNRTLIDLISTVLDMSPLEVCGALIDEEELLGASQIKEVNRFGLEPHVWSDEFVEFYRQTMMGPVGNVAWNRNPVKLVMRKTIGNFLTKHYPDGCRVLTIGDGSGFDSLYLAMLGCDVTYSEESRFSIRFAQSIFERADQLVRVVDDHHCISDEQFDVITCLDVLEHVPDPPEMVKSLARQLVPGGHLIAHAPFFYLTHNNPTHLKSNRKFSGDLKRLYRPAGLHPCESEMFWDPMILCNDATKRARGWRRLKIGLGGLLLASARIWNWPHEYVGFKKTSAVNSKWREELIELREELNDTAESQLGAEALLHVES